MVAMKYIRHLLSAAIFFMLWSNQSNAQAPSITSVSAINNSTSQTITINGSGFGSAPGGSCSTLPSTCDTSESAGLALFDGTEFSAGFAGAIPAGTYGTLVIPPNISFTDVYKLLIVSWSPTQIVLGGINYEGSPVDGSLTNGDSVSIFVFNGGVASGTCTVTVGSGAGCPNTLVASVLPLSRSVQVGSTATAFATMINAGSSNASGCTIAPATSIPANFVYQTTNPSTNALTGTANTPANIAAGQAQSFVIALTPTAAFAPTTVALAFSCANAPNPAASVTGVDTLNLSGSTTPVPDVVALGATVSNDGILHITGTGGSAAFAVATVDVGAGSTITATANTGSATLPLALSVCQTNSSTGACMATPSPSVTTTIAANATPTFAIFGTASGAIAFSPANSRIFVQFTDSGGALRGETSVAVQTQ